MNLKDKLNYYGKNKIPFICIISYDLTSWNVLPLETLEDDICYEIDIKKKSKSNLTISYTKKDFKLYLKQFNKVIEHIKAGSVYLLNLTLKTKIDNKLSLKEIFNNCNAKYKLYYKNKFISFSPETFIKISNNKISTFPMKGTIDASIDDAENKILNDKKELAEHTMIVDLMRNDLGIVSSNISVDKFRYIDKIRAGEKELYQVSSQISGTLNHQWNENIGDIITSLLPAGSITGTPKISAINIIDDIEDYDRDYFSGIWGIYDKNEFNSSVLIRYIQNENGKLFYKSGGGITLDSCSISEYNEIYDKVYIP